MKNSEDMKKKWAKVIATAWLDQKFKKHLIEHPEQALKEHGIDAPKGVHYKVLEDTEKNHHLVIPQKPTGTLSEAELTKIAAAGSDSLWCGYTLS